MSGQSSLFGDDELPATTVAAAAPQSIADWQVDRLRKALDARGLVSMDDRRQVVEGAVGRPVESLRSLTSSEGMQLLSQLAQQRVAGKSDRSTWDDRDEDTWIDRL